MSLPKPQIAIYKGRGVSAHSYRCLKKLLEERFETVAITASAINAGDLKDYLKAIVFPGGADVPYDRALSDEGINHIRAFVEKGGLYVGVCAGSYFASSAIDFTCADGSKICEARRLKFFNGTVKGPAYATYIESSHASALLVDLKIQDNIYPAYFNGGGHFIAYTPFKDNEILATYADTGLPSALQFKVGKGQAFLCSFHPEYNNEFLQKAIQAKENGYEALQVMLSRGINPEIATWFLAKISGLM